MFCIISWYFEIGLAATGLLIVYYGMISIRHVPGVTTFEYLSIGVTWFGSDT